MASLLSERAMLITISLTAWSARKLDKRVTAKVNRDHNAAYDAGRWNKLLLSKDSLVEIQKIDGEIRTYFYQNTSPWLDRDGTRILSTVKTAEALAWFRNKGYDRESAVGKFETGYPDFIEDAKTRLNGMFDPADYPAPSVIRSKFRFSYSIDPVPDSDDFRADIAAEQADDIRRQIEQQSHKAIETIVRDAYKRVELVVGRMVERLNAYSVKGTVGFNPMTGETPTKTTGRFHDTLVGNVRELVEILPALNITNDPGLAAIARRMVALTHEDAQALRDNPDARKTVAQDAAAILADVSAYLA